MDTLNKADIQEIVTATLGQRSNPLWLTMRRGRLTASSFGRVLQLARSGNPLAIAKFRKDTFSPCDLSRVPAIKWGVEHEADAIAEYERETGFRVMPTGLWLFEDGYLGASPDGKVYNGDTLVGILEVKCPWSIRNRCLESTADWLAHLPYLTRPKCLARNHQYYQQVQGQLAATGAPWCDFFIWTTNKTLRITIKPDHEWSQTSLPLLKNCYLNHILRAEDKNLIYHYVTSSSTQTDHPHHVDLDPETACDCVLHPKGALDF